MTGLEDRGVRPDAGTRHAGRHLYGYVDSEWRRRVALAQPYADHELWWGVPCGPTLAMVDPRKLRGLLDVLT